MKNPRRFRHSSPRRILLILALLSATGTLAASERAIASESVVCTPTIRPSWRAVSLWPDSATGWRR